MAIPKLKVKTGDSVVVLSGKNKGKKGKVIATFPRNNTVKVEGVNILKKHAKPTQKVPQGGIRDIEGPLNVSKVKVVCPTCEKATRVKGELLGEKWVRACKKCGEALDK